MKRHNLIVHTINGDYDIIFNSNETDPNEILRDFWEYYIRSNGIYGVCIYEIRKTHLPISINGANIVSVEIADTK